MSTGDLIFPTGQRERRKKKKQRYSKIDFFSKNILQDIMRDSISTIFIDYIVDHPSNTSWQIALLYIIKSINRQVIEVVLKNDRDASGVQFSWLSSSTFTMRTEVRNPHTPNEYLCKTPSPKRLYSIKNDRDIKMKWRLRSTSIPQGKGSNTSHAFDGRQSNWPLQLQWRKLLLYHIKTSLACINQECPLIIKTNQLKYPWHILPQKGEEGNSMFFNLRI